MQGQQTVRGRVLQAALVACATLTLAMLMAPLVTDGGFATAALAAASGALGLVLVLRAAWTDVHADADAARAEAAAARTEVERLRRALEVAPLAPLAPAPPAAEVATVDGEGPLERTRFLATLAHELRNPLHPLRSAAQILRLKSAADPEVAWAQGVIERQVAQMARLLDDLLDASRLTRGQLELQREFVGLGYVVELAVETSRPLLDAGRHRLEIALPDEPIELEADAVRLAQALANLLNNAATYTPAGGRVGIVARRERDAVTIAVRDTGIGIEPDRLERLFDVFWQATPGAPRPQGGLGLGLTLTRALVALHGGTVTAHSAGPGRGAEFVVRLPLAQATRPLGLEPAAGPPVAGRRVLVVDDNRDGADGLAMLLRLRGHEARTAADGPSALALAAEFRPEVVLLDIGLPGPSGYEVAERLRTMPEARDALVVALTGWGQDEDRRRALAAGCDEHCTKPFDPDALLERIAAPREHWRGAGATDRRRPRTLDFEGIGGL